MAEANKGNKHFRELCASYVLGALDEEEHREFEQMLDNATEQERQLYQKMKSVANQLSFTVEQHEPHPDIKKQLMDRISAQSDEGEEQSQKKDTQQIVANDELKSETDEEGSNLTSLGIATSFALLIITLSLIFYAFSLRSEIKENESVIEERESQITELGNNLQEKNDMLAVLESGNVNIVQMSGMEASPDGYGKMIWNEENSQALLQITNLPATPPDSIYQLWILTGDEPIRADGFSVNDSNKHFFLIEKFDGQSRKSANGFAVTLESESGSQQATGEMFLMGNMD